MDLLTLGILPRLWSGWGRGDILPSLSLGDLGDESLSLFLFLGSDLEESSLDLLDLELDFELDLLEELDLEELDFLESEDFDDLLDGLLSFLDLESESRGLSDFLSDLESFFESFETGFLLGSLLRGSLDSLGAALSVPYTNSLDA